MTVMSSYSRKRFVLRVLTPVHIGNGTELSALEIVSSPKRTVVLNIDAALSRLPVGRAQNLSTGEGLLRMLEQFKIPIEEVSYHILAGGLKLDRSGLRQAIRDGAGRPLIPGSSTKGALRTSIITGKLKNKMADGSTPLGKYVDNLRTKNPKFAAQTMESTLLRPGPNKGPHGDLLRSLLVADATFSHSDISVSIVKTASPGRTPLQTKPYSSFVESICAGSQAEVEIRLDYYLLRMEAQKMGFGHEEMSWEQLSRWSLDHMVHLLSVEKSYFRHLGWVGPANEIESLVSTMRSFPDGAIPLRMGWGVGWNTTTGGVATPNERCALIRQYRRIAKYDAKVYRDVHTFPKSRKILNADSSGGGGTMGWVVLLPAGEQRIPIPPPAPYSKRSNIGAVVSTGGAKSDDKPETEEIVWEGVTVVYTPGDGKLVTSKPEEKGKPFTTLSDLVKTGNIDEASVKKLKKKKKKSLPNVTVTIFKSGNTLKIIKVARPNGANT